MLVVILRVIDRIGGVRYIPGFDLLACTSHIVYLRNPTLLFCMPSICEVMSTLARRLQTPLPTAPSITPVTQFVTPLTAAATAVTVQRRCVTTSRLRGQCSQTRGRGSRPGGLAQLSELKWRVTDKRPPRESRPTSFTAQEMIERHVSVTLLSQSVWTCTAI